MFGLNLVVQAAGMVGFGLVLLYSRRLSLQFLLLRCVAGLLRIQVSPDLFERITSSLRNCASDFDDLFNRQPVDARRNFRLDWIVHEQLWERLERKESVPFLLTLTSRSVSSIDRAFSLALLTVPGYAFNGGRSFLPGGGSSSQATPRLDRPSILTSPGGGKLSSNAGEMQSLRRPSGMVYSPSNQERRESAIGRSDTRMSID